MKRLLKLLTAELVLAVLLSCSAYAESPDVIRTGDTIWFGAWNGEPISWIVLDSSLQNSGAPGMFLFAEYVVQPTGIQYSDYYAKWQDSTAQAWCGSFWDGAFAEAEQIAIPAAFKTTEGITNFFGLYWRPADLNGEHVFMISSDELSQYVGEDDGSEGLSGHTSDGTPAYYWLRSPHGYHEDYSGLVLDNNQVHDSLVYKNWGGRPAMNLDPQKLMYVEPVGENSWKAGLSDSSLSFSVTGMSINGETVDVSYASSVSGPYCDVILLDCKSDGSLSVLESLGQAKVSGTVRLNTSRLSSSDGEVFALAVRKSGGEHYTDFISDPSELQAEIRFESGKGTGEMESVKVVPGSFLGPIECGFSAPEGECFDHWEKNGITVTEDERIEEDSCLTAIYAPITVREIRTDYDGQPITVGSKIAITADVFPKEAINKTLVWSSKDPKIIQITESDSSHAELRAKKVGKTEIICASEDRGCSVSVPVEVLRKPFSSFFK